MSAPTVLFSYEAGCIRVDHKGQWHLCNRREKGWSSGSFWYPTLEALCAAWAVELGTPSIDSAGVLWTTKKPGASS